jgi:AraC-like DNA-binding protein
MNVKLLSLIERRVNKAIQLLSEFLSNSKPHDYLLKKQVSGYTDVVIETHIALFKALDILPHDFLYSVREMQIDYHPDNEFTRNGQLNKKVITYLNEITGSALDNSSASGYSFIPLHLNFYSSFSDLSTVFGLCLINHSARTVQVFLHEFTLNTRQINFSTHSLNYLDNVLLKFKSDPSVNIRNLSKTNNLSYQQFQKDCRQYFGTTFYDFTIKLKMMDVVEDLMFSKLMIKEIVYKHRFAEYSNMYKFFHRTYHFPFKNITRFYFSDKG